MHIMTATFFSCIVALATTLSAQESSLETSDTPITEEVQEQASASDSAAEVKEKPAAPVEDSVESTTTPSTPDEDSIVSLGEEEEEEEIEEEAEAEEEIDSDLPVSVSLNENGELVGQAMTKVNGEEVPIEASITITKNGVVVSKLLADEDGSFAFPNVTPGEYNMYGSASSYCGRQAFSVLQGAGGCDCVNLNLSQYAGGGEYGSFCGAPVASLGGGGTGGGFAGGIGGGGFGVGGGGFSGGGALAGGGGAVGGVSPLRLLAIGGIATGIALGVSDGDASPSE